MHPQIKINYQVVTGGGSSVYQKSLLAALSSDNPPDIFFEWNGELAGYFIDKGFCEALEKYYSVYNWNKTLINWTMDFSKRNGKIYGVPISVNAMTFWYNKNLFDKLKLKAPANYGELEKICETAKNAGIYPISLAGKFNWNIMRLLDFLLEVSCGPVLHDKLNLLEANWDRKEVIEAFTLFKKWIEKGWITKNFINTEPGNTKLALYNNSALMIFETSAFESTIIADKMDPVLFDFFMPPTEHKPMRMAGYTHQFMINKKSKYKAEAAKFLNFWLSSDIQERYQGKIVSFPSTVNISFDKNTLPGSFKWSMTLNKERHFFLPSDQIFNDELLNKFYYIQNSLILNILTPPQAAKKMDSFIYEWKGKKKSK